MKIKLKPPRWVIYTLILFAFAGGILVLSLLPCFGSPENPPVLAVAEALQTQTADGASSEPSFDAEKPDAEQGETKALVDDEHQSNDDTAAGDEGPAAEEPVQKVVATCSYCGSTEHTKDYCAVRAVDNGAVGRLKIPSVGVDVAVCDVTWYALQYTTEGDNYTQAVTDAWDSASQIVFLGQTVIADHNNQGFSAINNCSEGTYAYIDMGDSVLTYICTGIQRGRNPGGYLTGADGDSVYTSYFNPGGLTLYTCLDHNFNVAIVTFQPA